MKLNKNIFKAYDIRGEYPEEINEKIFFLIGIAWARILKSQKKIFSKNAESAVIGRDMRAGSAELARALAAGALQEGLNIDYLGMCATPLVYWSLAKKRYLGGAMITASHNPSKFNGVKLCKYKADPINPKEIIRKIAALPENFIKKDPTMRLSAKGRLRKISYSEEYINFIKSFYKKTSRHLKITVDAAFAMASEEIPFIFNGMNIDFIPLCFGPRENFSDTDINPMNKNALNDLSKITRKYKADFGIAFDGDADRIFFTDEKGEAVDPEIITALISSDILAKKPKSKFAIDSRSGKISQNPIQKLGGSYTISKAGRTNLQKAMKRHNAVFGAETTGHYFFKESFFADNAMIAMMKVINILGFSKEKFSEMAKKLKIRQKSREINFATKNSEEALKNTERHFKKNWKKISISHLDGLSIKHSQWKFNLRRSNTEPELLRLNAEAEDEENLRKIINEIKKQIRAVFS